MHSPNQVFELQATFLVMDQNQPPHTLKHSNKNNQLALKIQAIVVRRREGKVHVAIGLKKKTKFWLMPGSS
jgi:hypothetical protein